MQDRRIASPLRGLPAAPEYLFGRDKILNDMIGSLTKDARQSKHMALYGTIGTGKSTIARMLVNRVEVARVFGRSRHWVRCQSAPNVEALLHSLATSLSLKKRTNCPLTDIIEHLEIHPSSLLIVFDDFQMPEDDAEIEKLTDALGKLGQCRSANVCILLTTRDLPLPEGVAWLHFLVEPLSIDAAMAMFRAISGQQEDNDEEVKELVQALGCLPFSISIVARQRQLQLKPAELLRQLESGQDKRLGRIDDVVRISLRSRRFVDDPDALTLLSILARLPKGVQYDNLPRIAPLIRNVFDLLRIILESGHANREADDFILVQAPTRSYLLRYHPLDARHARALRAYYFQLCQDGGHELGTETFKNASKALALEEENARAVLLDALQNEPSTDTLKAVVGYANFLYQDVPNSDVTAKALEVIEGNPSLDTDGTLFPHCWFSHGRLLFRLDKYIETAEAMKKAESVWKKTEEFALLGECYGFYGQVNRLLGRHAESVESFMMAREYFEKVGNNPGIAYSLQGLALLSLRAGDVKEALRLLGHAKEACGGHGPSAIIVSYYIAWALRFENPGYSVSLLLVAREAYVKYGARNRAALCTYQMGIAQYSWGRNDEAEKSLLRAYREFDELHNHGQMGYTLDHLAELEIRRHNYDQALQYNGEARATFEQIGNHAEVADCYISRGRVFAQMRQKQNALAAYNTAKNIVTRHCNGDSILIRMIDDETRLLVGILGWRRLLPW